MTITRRPFRGEADVPRILELICRMPLSCRHVIDLPWRLSSPTINEGRDAAFWEDSEGQVIGFAAWQYYWAALDYFILPGPEVQRVETDLFRWADERFRERDEERGRPLPYWVEFRDDDRERRQIAEAHGFLLDDDDSNVCLRHSLGTSFCWRCSGVSRSTEPAVRSSNPLPIICRFGAPVSLLAVSRYILSTAKENG